MPEDNDLHVAPRFKNTVSFNDTPSSIQISSEIPNSVQTPNQINFQRAESSPKNSLKQLLSSITGIPDESDNFIGENNESQNNGNLSSGNDNIELSNGEIITDTSWKKARRMAKSRSFTSCVRAAFGKHHQLKPHVGDVVICPKTGKRGSIWKIGDKMTN